jgi:hypothetical protein
MTVETKQMLATVVGGAVGYAATHYLIGANPLVGLVIGAFTPWVVALIRGDDLRLWKRKAKK